MININN